MSCSSMFAASQQGSTRCYLHLVARKHNIAQEHKGSQVAVTNHELQEQPH